MTSFTLGLRTRIGTNKNLLVISVAALLVLLIVIAETVAPANIVGAYGFVLPILLMATARSRRLMIVTVFLCVVATYISLMRPMKPGRVVSALINRTVVAGVLIGVGYFAMTREERKAREEAARAELARQTEHLLQANVQLAEIKDALNRSERLAAVGQLVASVAHEVGTPLHSISWHVQALGEDAQATPEMRKRIEIIENQLGRVVRIIEDLLSSTRQRKPKVELLPPSRLVEPVVALMEPSFANKGVVLTWQPDQGVLPLWGDPEQLQQVLVNLLTNALAATGSGGTVVVGATTRERVSEELADHLRAGDCALPQVVVLWVQDSGCGMPKEHLARAFEPFFTTKALGRGTGLGLFLSHEIVKAHGGVLTLDSEEGTGTTVTMVLPAATPEGLVTEVGSAHG
jgi:signal transduction histidine kinase